MDWTARRKIEESDHAVYPMECITPPGCYQMGGWPYGSFVGGDTNWAEYHTNWKDTRRSEVS